MQYENKIYTKAEMQEQGEAVKIFLSEIKLHSFIGISPCQARSVKRLFFDLWIYSWLIKAKSTLKRIRKTLIFRFVDLFLACQKLCPYNGVNFKK